MTFREIRALIDDQLALEPRLVGSDHELDGDRSIWRLKREVVIISASGTTGIHVAYESNGGLTHERIFAASALIVERVVHTIAEHLTGYAYRRT